VSDDFFLFVSHVTEDRAAAMEIVAELEKRGVQCWIAPRNIAPGTRFDDQIADAIEGCRAMLLIFSDHCNSSEYIGREITVAGESHKLIIPFRIEEVQPKRGLRVRLSDLHWIDGFIERERAIDELAAAVTKKPAAPREAASPPLPRQNEPAPTSRAWPWRSFLYVAATVAVLIAVLLQFILAPHSAAPPAPAQTAAAPAAANAQLTQAKQSAETAAAEARAAAAKAQTTAQRAEQEATAAEKGAAGHYAGPAPAPGNPANRYEGEMQAGANGDQVFGPYGVFTLASGERVEGQFDTYGVPSGNNVRTWPNGDRYDGEEKNINGRAMKSGDGVLSKAGGDRYEGQFANDAPGGYGIFYGGPARPFLQYEGEIAGGNWNGTGVTLMKDGSVQAGVWKNGVLQTPAQTAQH
jgi:hypothetical protein